MRVDTTDLLDAKLISLEPIRDERGFFARTFCEREFEAAGIVTRFPQHSLSHNAKKGTLRGIHFNLAPDEEAKLVRCVRGAIWDVIVDLRPQSPTYRRWQGFELSDENDRQLFIPAGFGHGFQTLADDTDVHYLISEFYAARAASGIRYDDPAFAITWPLPVSVINTKDLSWAPFSG